MKSTPLCETDAASPIDMHSTLHPKNNRFLSACLTAGVVVLLLLTSGAALLTCVFGAAFGAWAGVLQNKALRRDAEQFRAADTAWDLRRVMVASKEGKRAITLGWISAGLLFIPAAFGFDASRVRQAGCGLFHVYARS
jgi:hypothetical protein